MTQVLAGTTALFRDRDLFVHDGTKLRRFRVSAPVQLKDGAMGSRKVKESKRCSSYGFQSAYGWE